MTPSPGTVRLAVIDTDSSFVHVLAKRLEAAGWEHRLLTSTVPLDELVAMKLNALVIDPGALGSMGWEYLERVCTSLPDLGLIVVSHGSTVAQRVRGLRMGADDWVSKPCHPEEVLARVEAVARRRKRGQATAEAGPLVAGELEIRPDQFQAYVVGTEPQPHPPRVRVAPQPRRGKRQGARARGDLSAGLGLHDGPRRPLRRRLHPQASLEAPERASSDWAYVHTHFGVGYRFEAEPADGTLAAPDQPLEPQLEAAEAAPREAPLKAHQGLNPPLVHILFTRWSHGGNKIATCRWQPEVTSGGSLAQLCAQPRSALTSSVMTTRETSNVTRKNWLLAVGASGVLALGLGACGDDDDSGSSETEGPSGPHRRDPDRRLEHGSALC